MVVGCTYAQLDARVVVGCSQARWFGVTGGLPQKVCALRRIIARFPNCGGLSPGGCHRGGNARNPPGVPEGWCCHKQESGSYARGPLGVHVRAVLPETRSPREEEEGIGAAELVTITLMVVMICISTVATYRKS